MIATYLYDKSELNRMGDIVVLTLKDYSFSMPRSFTIEEIIDIKNSTDKKVYLSITPLFHEDEMDKVIEIIEKLKRLDGFIFQDLGLMNTFKRLGIMDKAIYAPETFITTSLDKHFFESSGLNRFLLSREITLEDIKSIISNKQNTTYMYSAFGYQELFYSYRNHFSNFNSHYSYGYDLKDRFDITMEEETRTQRFRTIEDSRGFRVYRDKPFDSIPETRNLGIDIILTERIFMEDMEYFDAISFLKGEMSEMEFYGKYPMSSFEKGYLYKKTGLLKEKGNE